MQFSTVVLNDGNGNFGCVSVLVDQAGLLTRYTGFIPDAPLQRR